MSHWIFVVTRKKDGGESAIAMEVFRQRMADEFWGIYEKSQRRNEIAAGDQIVFYVGTPDKVFAGTAVAASGLFQLNDNERRQYGHGSQIYTMEQGIRLEDTRVREKPLKAESIVHRLSFVENQAAWNAYFQRSIIPITEEDFNLATSTPHRSPNWTRDELILALDLYFRVNPRHTSSRNQDIMELTSLLNSLPIHAGVLRGAAFRNPLGVYRKLCNFWHLDPDNPGEGLKNLSHLDREVWDEFKDDKVHLKNTATQIRENYEYVEPVIDEIDDEETFQEGRVVTLLHKRFERSGSAPKQKKKRVLAQTGKLSCEVCGFDFAERYRDIGEGFAECHHVVPVSELNGTQKTRLKDLAIVCPNCHRMLHRSRPSKTIKELITIVQIVSANLP
jgi:5-methylcytosine-specific restriction protein A